jgi:uncharacterized protein
MLDNHHDHPSTADRQPHQGPHHKALKRMKKGNSTKSWQAGLCSLLLLPVMALAEPGFWHASKDGRNLWILGSIHVGQENFYPLPKPIETAWQQADVLIVEADMRAISEQDTQEIAQLSQLPAGDNLANHLSPVLYQQVVKQAAHYGLPEAAIRPLRPWVAAITLMQQALAGAGYQADLGIDEHFSSQAARMGVPVRGLERVPEQLAYLAGMNELEDDFLQSTVEQIDTMQTEIPKLIQAWQDGDGPALQKMLSEEQGSPELQELMERRLLKERNHNWLPKLIAMPEKNQFMVVGALHLYGPDGVLNLLRQQGYQLQVVTDAHE